MKNVLIFREEWRDAILMLGKFRMNPATYEQLLMDIFRYAFDGKKPNLDEYIEKFGGEAVILLELIFCQIDRDREED